MLLHYEADRIGGGWTSLADSDVFFLAPNGKTDPQAELEATLAAFLDPDARVGENERLPQCAFIARYHWLAEELSFDPKRLPPVPCPDYEEWRRALGGAGVTLIFAETYMNNPASMFGHTLLRIDAAPPGATEKRRDLLAYAVNYAAFTEGDLGFAYALKGVAGGYPGYFSVTSYYDKVKEYADWESRDLWEYRLDLEPHEINRMLQHLWELGEVFFDYYFFDENCSYALLGLVEAARPELRLRERFRAWVIPVETVREIVDEAGVASEISWRPSATARLKHQAAHVSRAERKLARELAEGEASPDDPRLEALSDEDRSAVLAMAHDLIAIKGGEDDTELKRRRLGLLIARSKLAVVGEPAGRPARPKVRPDEGHESTRFSLGTGSLDGRWFWEARFRPALHSLTDPIGGYVEGAEIAVLDTALRYYPDGNDVELQDLTLLRIASLTPRDELFQPISFKLNTGVTNRLLRGKNSGDDLRNGLLWRTNGGAGLSLRPWSGALAYAMLEGVFDVSGKLRSDFALGVGSSFGLLTGDDADRWRGHLHAEVMRYVAGDTRTSFGIGLDQRLRITRSHSLELKLGVQHDFHETWLDTGLYWHIYF